MLYSLIMAGGAGTRFWPVSRQRRPKQLLNLASDRSLLQETAARLDELIPADRRLVMTNESLVDAVREQLPQAPKDAVIGEPAKRDTAPCVALAAALMLLRDPDAVMLVTPADHVIRDVEAFHRAVRFSYELVQEQHTRLVTFGIRPHYPAESFGYIERGERLNTSVAPVPGAPAFQVRQFREKPDRATAEEYLAAGTFYWNAGIFVWRADTILNLALRKFEPEITAAIDTIAAAWNSPERARVFQETFESIRGKSIDYAVMERYDDVVVVEAPFDWDDLGSWKAIARLRGADDDGNTVVGCHIGKLTSNCIIRSDESHLVATYHVDNLIIVHTEDATLVACRDDEESVRALVDALKERGWDDYL